MAIIQAALVLTLACTALSQQANQAHAGAGTLGPAGGFAGGHAAGGFAGAARGPAGLAGPAAASLALGIPYNDPITKKTHYPLRNLPADVLRDFPGVCYAYLRHNFFEVGQSWDLGPSFCGTATCVTDGVVLIEQVQDCGIPPKNNPKCELQTQDPKDSTPPKKFPDCCPKFTCIDGAELEYPTAEELRLQAQQAHAAQVAAAAQQQQSILAAQAAAAAGGSGGAGNRRTRPGVGNRRQNPGAAGQQ